MGFETTSSMVDAGLQCLLLIENAYRVIERENRLRRLRHCVPAWALACLVVLLGFLATKLPISQESFVTSNTPPSNYLFVGNPGVGKSAVLNGMLGYPAFKSGVKFGSGLTTVLNTVNHSGSSFMDTPGLDDPEIRAAAAKEISRALKAPGSFKVFFVITLEAGRVRPADKVLMELILDAAPTLDKYGVIINKLPKRTAKLLQSNESELSTVKTYLMGNLQKPSGRVFLLEHNPDLDGFDDVSWTAPKHLWSFVHDTPTTTIGEENVIDIEVHNYTALVEQNGEALAALEKSERELTQLKNDMNQRLAEIEAEKNEYARRMQEHQDAVGELEKRLELSDKQKESLKDEMSNLTFKQQEQIAVIMERLNNHSKESKQNAIAKERLQEQMKVLVEKQDKEMRLVNETHAAEVSRLKDERTASESRFQNDTLELQRRFQKEMDEIRARQREVDATEDKIKDTANAFEAARKRILRNPAELSLLRLIRDLQHEEPVPPTGQPVFLEVDGFEYRLVMEGVAVDGEGESCHRGWIPSPPDFEIAPDIEYVRTEVVAKHTWSTHVVVLGSFKGYATAWARSVRMMNGQSISPGSEYGDEQPKAEVKKVNGVSGYKMGPWTCYQVLVRRKVSTLG